MHKIYAISKQLELENARQQIEKLNEIIGGGCKHQNRVCEGGGTKLRYFTTIIILSLLSDTVHVVKTHMQ